MSRGTLDPAALTSSFAYGAFTLSGRSFQDRSAGFVSGFRSPNPGAHRTPVWAPPVSLAATPGIDVSFFSSGYLDVSVRRVPLHNLFDLRLIQLWIHGVFPCGFPHSDIRGSPDICSSPRLFAAYRVFLRLPVPRHPPCALSRLTSPHAAYSVTRVLLFLLLFYC